MPKIVDKQQLDEISALLAPHEAGLSAAELERACKAWGLEFDRRTLQRRLGQLIKTSRVVKQGGGRASRYRLAPLTGEANFGLPLMQFLAEGETYVPISAAGKEIRDYVRQPVQNRKPVGYNREFLEAYRPNETWYFTPEIRGHLHHIGRSPAAERPAGTYARDIMNRLLIDLSWASSRLEGNTYTRLDTQNLIEKGLAAEGKDQLEAQMILNHKAAIELLIGQAEEIGFNTFTFFNLHALLSENLLHNPRDSGRTREAIVDIDGTVFHPLGVPQQIDDYFRLILDKAGAIGDPFEQSFFIMVQIPYLQPFIDVNKRVSRLGANISLIRRNLCPLSFVDVPERAYVEGALGIYELNRIELLRDVFVWAYERSCQQYLAIKQSLPEPDAFRLKYRAALIETVSGIVRSRQPATGGTVRSLSKGSVPEADLDRFVAIALSELEHLHEGNVARYQLRLSEYRSWKQSLEGTAP